MGRPTLRLSALTGRVGHIPPFVYRRGRYHPQKSQESYSTQMSNNIELYNAIHT